MKQSQHFLDNAENCAQLAERATDEPTHLRYKRMEAAWRALRMPAVFRCLVMDLTPIAPEVPSPSQARRKISRTVSRPERDRSPRFS